MHDLVILGAGKIGRMVCHMLATCGDYAVRIGDVSVEALERISRRVGVNTMPVDVESPAQLSAAFEHCDAVISALSFFHNARVAEAALAAGVS